MLQNLCTGCMMNRNKTGFLYTRTWQLTPTGTGNAKGILFPKLKIQLKVVIWEYWVYSSCFTGNAGLHHETGILEVLTEMGEALGLVNKLPKELLWRWQCQPVTKVCLTFCLSPGTRGFCLVHQVTALACPVCLSSNFVSVHVWSSACIECLYTEGWCLLSVHYVCWQLRVYTAAIYW